MRRPRIQIWASTSFLGQSNFIFFAIFLTRRHFSEVLRRIHTQTFVGGSFLARRTHHPCTRVVYADAPQARRRTKQ